MRKFFILLGSAVAMTTFAQAENWTGKLLDASCYDRTHTQGQSTSTGTTGQTTATQGQSQSTTQSQTQAQQGQQGQTTTGRTTGATAGQDATCTANAQTTMFALEAMGKVYKLDDNGNTRAMAALKNRADRSSPTGQSTTTQGQANQQREVTAKVDGTESGGTIKVTTIELQ